MMPSRAAPLQTPLGSISRSGLVVLAAGCVAIGNLALALPSLTSIVHLPNDVIGYVATARSWIEGQGFVEPIMYSYYLEGARVPIPAIAVRSPFVSILFAIPLKLGFGLLGLSIAHALWSAAIGSSIVILGSRFMSLTAATAAAVGVTWSHGWRVASTHLLTEATHIGALLLLLALTPYWLRTPRGGALLAGATLLGWLVRPNLGAFAAVVVIAAVLNWGAAKAIRSKPLWIYLLTFGVLHQATVWALGAIFGFPPYAHYGVMAETLDMTDVRSYQIEYAGPLNFAAAHSTAIVSDLALNTKATFERFFLMPTYLFVGWIGLPGLVYVLLRRSQENLFLVLSAVSSIVFAAIAIATGWGFSGLRYPLTAAVCLWLVGMASCDSLLARAASRRSETGGPLFLRLLRLRGLVLAIPLAAWLVALPQTRVLTEIAQDLAMDGVRPRLQNGARWNRLSRSLCDFVPPDAIVASANPWNIYYWCGNAGYLIPKDLADLKWLHQYLTELEPDYVVASNIKDIELFSSSPRLGFVRKKGPVVLYAVAHGTSDSKQWKSLGPMHDLLTSRALPPEAH